MPTTLPICLFLDLDGTLLELATHPDSVAVPSELRDVLRANRENLGDAVAIVSGRSIEVIDRLLHPYLGHAVGVHGLEQRLAGSAIQRRQVLPLPGELHAGIYRIAERFPGTIVEEKAGTLAIHERGDGPAARELFDMISNACRELAPEWQCLRGHRVLEVKPSDTSKGTAVEWLMQQPAFAGRVPLAIGDDITDLDMFAAVAGLGGLTISVGDRIPGAGRIHMRSPGQVIAFLRQLAENSRLQNIADVEKVAWEASRNHCQSR